MKIVYGSIVLLAGLAGCSTLAQNDGGTGAEAAMDVASALDISTPIDAMPVDATLVDDAASDAVAYANDAADRTTPQTGCGTLVTCLDACTSASCMDACLFNTTDHGLMLFNTLTMCSFESCNRQYDAGPGLCFDPSSENCAICVLETHRGGAAGDCDDPTDPYCATCSTQYDTCVADP